MKFLENKNRKISACYVFAISIFLNYTVLSSPTSHAQPGEVIQAPSRTTSGDTPQAPASQIPITHTQSAKIISQIKVEGNSRVETSTILIQTKSKAGETYDAEAIERDLKNIYRTGFFQSVDVEVEDLTSNKIIVIFKVEEKPSIRNISISGNNELSEDTVKEKLNVANRRFFDKRKINAGIDQLIAAYQDKGYYNTEVSFTTKETADHKVDITFIVKEGIKKVIRNVRFEGNKDFDSDDLSSVISTSTRGFFSWLTGSGIVRQEQLSNDTKMLSQFYLNKGYAEVSISEARVEELEKEDKESDALEVVFSINEGAKYHFGKISAEGTLLDNSPQKTIEGIQSKAGETFQVDSLRADTFKVTEKFTDIGYAFANVEPLTSLNREQKLVDVSFKVEKGKSVTIDKIEITGNKKTDDNVVRRNLKINEQERYSSSKIKRSQELVQRLGLFDEVTITPDQTTNPGQDDKVDLNVNVKEGNTGSFSFGAGLSSGDGFIVSSRINERNLFGSGNSLSLDINTGNRNRNYVLSFENPRVADSYLSVGVDLLSFERSFEDFDRGQLGGSVNVGYPLLFLGDDAIDDYRFVTSYELLNIDISNVEDTAATLIKNQKGSSVSSSITPKLIRNTIDNPMDPTSGSRQVLSTELAGLGGDQEFWLAEATSSLYYPLWDSSFGKFIFAQRTRLGYGDTFNDEDFPLYKRFFPGGINSVRGYDFRRLGPKEGTSYFGGSKQLITNFEMIFPIVEKIGLRGVLFYDAGNAFDDSESIDVANFKQAIGFGFRWRTPLAPIRIEFGFPLDKEQDSKNFITNFTFGSPL